MPSQTLPTQTVSVEVQNLLNKCIGQRVKIPNLYSLCPTWSPTLNPYEGEVREALRQWRDHWIKDSTNRRRNEQVDVTLFVRGITPEAELPELQTFADWGSWVYLWDDTLDFGYFDQKPEELEVFRLQTIDCIYQSVNGVQSTTHGRSLPPPTHPAILSLCDIGTTLGRDSQSDPTRDFIVETWVDYVNAAVRLQLAFDKQDILSIESYYADRMDSSAVYITVAIALYTTKIAWPKWFFANDMMREACRLANVIISISNDIVSARHEVQNKHVDNLIPLLVYHKSITVQQAVFEAGCVIRDAYDAFEAIAPKLRELGKMHDFEDEMEVFLSCCINSCVGIFQWVYGIKRFLSCKPGVGNTDVFTVLGMDHAIEVE